MLKRGRFSFVMAMVAIILVLSLVMVGCSSSKPAQTTQPNQEVSWPQKDKVVRVIVPYGTGGGADQVGRILSGVAQEKTGGKFVVENKVGGAGSLGLDEMSKAAPDGYTLAVMPSNISIFKASGVSQLTYQDFKLAVAVNYDACALIVRKDSGWNSFEDFKKAAESKKLNIATGSAGGLWHLGAIKLQQATGLELNMIPMATGGAPAATILMGKNADGIIIAPNEAASQIKSGDFKILGVMAPERSEQFKDVPTFKELGYDVDVRSVRGIAVPKGTPDDIVKKIQEMFSEAAKDPKYTDYMKNSLSNATFMSSEDYTKYCEGELTLYSQLMKDAGLAK